jgi:hypothetical protein
MVNKAPSIRELALAALARQRGKDETPHETTMRQGVSHPPHASHARETPLAESNQSLNPSVSSSHSLGVRQMRHPNNNETPHETVVRQVCAHCGNPGGIPVAYGDREAIVHPHCRDAWRAAQDAVFNQRFRLAAGSS